MKMKNVLLDFKEFINYIKDYKRNTKELVNLQTDLGTARYYNKELTKELATVVSMKNKYLQTIKEKNKQIRQLKKEIKEMEK